MSNTLLFHKSLTSEMISQIGYQEQPSKGYYFSQGEEIEIDIVALDDSLSSYKIEDPRVIWDPEIHEINFIKQIEIAHPQFLFGDDGLVDEQESVGIALRWYSKESSMVVVKEVASISVKDLSVEINIEEKIESGILRGNVTFEIILVDKIIGRILGTLSNQTIVLDGNSSLFPIQEVEYKGEPLWWVTLNYSDPMVDEFDLSNVAISLNFAHKNAKHLKLDKGVKSSPLLVEIISSALEIIINDVKESQDWISIMNNESDEGSIGAIVHYFINTFEWDVSSPALLAKSIREDLDTRF